MWISVAVPVAMKGSLPISAQDQQQKVDQLRLRRKKTSGFLKMEIWSRAGNGRSDASVELGSSSSSSLSSRSAMQRQNRKSSILDDGRCLAAGCWMNIFWKLKAEWKKMVVNMSRPATTQRFQYDAFSYAQNFDDGCWHDDWVSFSTSTLGSSREQPPLGDC